MRNCELVEMKPAQLVKQQNLPANVVFLHKVPSSVFLLAVPFCLCQSFLGWNYLHICVLCKVHKVHANISN